MEVITTETFVSKLSNPLTADLKQIGGKMGLEFVGTVALQALLLEVIRSCVVVVEHGIHGSRTACVSQTGTLTDKTDGLGPDGIIHLAKLCLCLCIVEKDLGVTHNRNGVTALCDLELDLFFDIPFGKVVACVGQVARHPLGISLARDGFVCKTYVVDVVV